MLPVGNYLKIGETRSEAGVVKRWNGTAWLVDGTGTADISDWPVVGIEEEEVREDVVTGKKFIFRSGAWIPFVEQGASIPETVMDEMENYVDIELGAEVTEALVPLYVHADGKAYPYPTTNSYRIGISPTFGPAGTMVKAYPIGFVKNLSGIVPKRRYEVKYVLETLVLNTGIPLQPNHPFVVGDELFIIGAGGGASCKKINLVTKAVTDLTNVPEGFLDYKVEYADGSIFIIGGTVNALSHIISRFDMNMDPVEMTGPWHLPEYTVMGNYDSKIRTLAIGNDIYVMSSPDATLSNIQKFDATTETWTTLLEDSVHDIYNTIPFHFQNETDNLIVMLGGIIAEGGYPSNRQLVFDLNTNVLLNVTDLNPRLPFGMNKGYACKIGTEYVVCVTGGDNRRAFTWNNGYTGYWGGNSQERNFFDLDITSSATKIYGVGFYNESAGMNSSVSEIIKNHQRELTYDTYEMGRSVYMIGISENSALSISNINAF